METDFKTFLDFVDDDSILNALDHIDNIEIRLSALEALLRDAQSAEDVEPFRHAVESTFEIFFNRVAEALPGKGVDRLWEFALPPLNLTEPQKRERSKPIWNWPIVNTVPGNGRSFDGAFRDFSALKMFGYTVGRTNGWPKQQRERFLDDFMRLELPKSVTDHFGDEYGSPMSTNRLRKIANTIASNCQLRYRNDPRKYRQAIFDWESDLNFLKQTFYDREGLKFIPWPDPRDY